MIDSETQKRSILLRYHEIAIKGQNRRWFENHLALNAEKLILRNFEKNEEMKNLFEKIEVRRVHGRILLETQWNEATRSALEHLFGISSFSPMRKVKTERATLLEAAIDEAEKYFQSQGLPKTFRVRTRRSDKVFPETSMDLDRWIGSEIHDRFPSLQVDLENPDFILEVEIRRGESFIWTKKFPAQGGLPVGTQGKILSLISGGIDSPVAAIQLLKRGASVEFVHFYGTPFVGEEALVKVEDLVRIVNEFQPHPQPLLVIPFGKIQEKIASVTDPKMRTLLYRRMMIRIANELAHKRGALALATGESLGQVASQTLDNMRIIHSVSKIPILQPLIAFDKEEIILKAQRWKTFETSIQPTADCCTLFADRHPILRATEDKVEAQEKKFSISQLIEEALSQVEIHDLG